MHENVFNGYPDADISGFIIWIPILDEDTFEAAVPSVKALNDPRIRHYYDKQQVAGKTIAESVGWRGYTAWDIYLFYTPETQWLDTAPGASHWMHQLTDSWATKEMYRTGFDLRNELFISMEHLVMK